MANYKHSLIKDGQGAHIPFPPFITQREMDIIANEFVVQDGDVFTVTFPKCGTTWMEQIIHLLFNNGEQGEKKLGDAVPWVETLPNRPLGFENFLKTMTGQRLFTSHLPYQLMPGLQNRAARFVYVARNPKDVAISYYYHDRSKAGYEGTWKEYFHLFVEGKVMYGSFFDHVLTWWEVSRKSENILFLKYEDMKSNIRETVAEVADFLDIKANEELIERVIGKSRFQSMAANQKTNLHWVPQREGVPGHFRKGVVGDWRNHFSAEQNEMFDAFYLEKMSGTGLRFDFGEGLILP